MIPQSLDSLIESHDLHAAGLQGLQAHTVREILLVASLYDSFVLSEGEHLSELIFGAYHNLSLASPPQITRVSTRQRALELIAERPFDLVISMAQVADMSAVEFGEAAKGLRPQLPVFLMGYHTRELRSSLAGHRPTGIPGVIDRTFIWRGDVRLFLAIIKLVEDQLNVAHDTLAGGVRTLILIEDSVTFYSSYLPMLFDEVVKQTEALMGEGVNLGQRLLRLRLRPKILLATTFEEGWALYEAYRETVLGVISDVQFTRGGTEDSEAGVALLKRIHDQDTDTPLLLQSSHDRYSERAQEIGVGFMHKNSPTLLHDFRTFMIEYLGFGDFVFRRPNGAEVARAGDVNGLIAALSTVPGEALMFHGSRNHFSNWLMARTEFRLATSLRKLRVDDFPTADDMRRLLITTLTDLQAERRRGQVADFDARSFDTTLPFVRIGGGSLGGKGRGLAFMHELIASSNAEGELDGELGDVRIFVPQSAVIGTDVFDRFLQQNDLLEYALHEADDRALLNRFLAARLPADIHADLRAYLERIRYPLAVRSSSLLEDSHHVPAAGIYPTHMLANVAPDVELRLHELEQAIQHIYASTFFQGAKAYLTSTSNRVEEEKMAVVLQQIVGRRHGDVVYPDLAGVARSLNFYPVRNMRPEDGIASVALGLGRTVVEGGRAVRFSPAHPQFLPQFSTPHDVLENAQREFWALSLTVPPNFRSPDASVNQVKLDLAWAERNGTLLPVASVYSPDNDAIYDGLSRPGIRIVTFAPILKHGTFPLARAIQMLLELGKVGMSGPVEIEFAANLKPDAGGQQEFACLQIRPLVLNTATATVDVASVAQEDVFVRTHQALGVGRIADIADIVVVRRDTFDRARTLEVAAEIGRVNARLQAAGRPYLLMGPGRWGTADRWLGVPVSWSQISGARTILECDLADLSVEPSQGTHFFHNMTSLGIGYFTVRERMGGTIDWDWLEALEPAEDSGGVRHYALAAPLEVLIDGRTGAGVILKRGSGE